MFKIGKIEGKKVEQRKNHILYADELSPEFKLKNNIKKPFKYDWNGYILECSKAGCMILAVYMGSDVEQKIRVGQLVKANSKSCFPDLINRLGIVQRIYKPYLGGRSNDIILVHFEGNLHPTLMKYKELQPIRKKNGK